ncbi:hypothetical protein KM043_014303 [Ampulex compressa]|nr:hypothetical protein KM043_014303 [Ampulex compressa]
MLGLDGGEKEAERSGGACRFSENSTALIPETTALPAFGSINLAGTNALSLPGRRVPPRLVCAQKKLPNYENGFCTLKAPPTECLTDEDILLELS